MTSVILLLVFVPQEDHLTALMWLSTQSRISPGLFKTKSLTHSSDIY